MESEGLLPHLQAHAFHLHLSLTWVTAIQSTPPHPTSWGTILTFHKAKNFNLPNEKKLFISSGVISWKQAEILTGAKKARECT